MHGTILTTSEPELDGFTDKTDPDCVYVCIATKGTPFSAPKWKIKRIRSVGNYIYIGWANDAIADNRATSVVYSL